MFDCTSISSKQIPQNSYLTKVCKMDAQTIDFCNHPEHPNRAAKNILPSHLNNGTSSNSCNLSLNTCFNRFILPSGRSAGFEKPAGCNPWNPEVNQGPSLKRTASSQWIGRSFSVVLFHCTGLLVLSQQEAMPSVDQGIKAMKTHPGCLGYI